MWALVVALGLTTAHAAVAAAAETTAGVLLVLDHLFAIVAAGAVLSLCVAAGQRILRVITIEIESSVEVLAFAAMLGAGALSTALLVAGAVGGFRDWALVLLLVVVALVVRRELGAVPDLARAAGREWVAMSGMPATLGLAAVAIAMLVLAVAPPVDTDSLNYHIRIPAQFLERGRIFLPDDNLHVAWVGLAHLLYLPLLALGIPSGPAVLNVMVAILLAISLAPAATRLAGTPSAARIAPLLLWGSTMVLLVAVTPKIDVTLALFLFLGHSALLRADGGGAATRRWLVVAGLGLGFGVGIKLLALPFILAILPVVAAVAIGVPRADRARALAAFAMAGAAASLPWLVKNWLLVGAPFYPELAAPILPPWLEAIHGSRSLPAGLDAANLSPLRDVREPFNLVDWFLAPERLTPESEGRAYGANPLFLLLVLALPLVRQRAVALLLAPVVVYVAIAMFLGSRINLRYLVPVLPALTVATALVIGRLADRIRSPRWRSAVLATATLVAQYGPIRALERKLDLRPVVSHAAGLVSRQDYRLTARDVEVAPYARITARANAVLPRDARVLLLFEPRGYGFDAEVLSDHLMTNWVLLEPAVTAPRCLQGSGITHVLVGRGTLEYLVGRGMDARSIHWDRFDAFAARCLEKLEEHTELTLYRVVAAPR